MNSTRFLLGNKLLALAFLTLIFSACKKSTKMPDELNPNEVATRAELISRISAERKDQPFSYFAEVYAPGKGFYSDLNGDMIDLKKIRKSQRGYECPDPGDEYYSEAITGIGTSYSCSVGYRVECANTYGVSKKA